MTKAFVLHSGGIDSTTCLALAFHEHGAPQVRSVSVDYGQRHKREIEAAKACALYFNVKHEVIQLGPQPRSMLTDSQIEVPSISYDEIKGVSPTYVPFRNGQLLSVIAALASSTLKTGDEAQIYFGAHAEDAKNWAYPDCTPEFIGAMANAIFIGTYMQVRLVAPLTFLNKAAIIDLGEGLSAPWHLTWSCYKGERLHCGTCPTCRSRRKGFLEADIEDPTEYAA